MVPAQSLWEDAVLGGGQGPCRGQGPGPELEELAQEIPPHFRVGTKQYRNNVPSLCSQKTDEPP